MKQTRFSILAVVISVSALVCAAEEFKIPGEKWSWENYPREEVPPLTEELQARVAARPKASARRIIGSNGAPMLEVNGKPMLHDTYITMNRVPRDGLWVSTIRDVGAPIITASYNFAKHEPERGWAERYQLNSRNFFNGWGVYDSSSLEPWLWRYLRVYPEAYIIIRINPDDYPGFPEEYPDELMRNEQGKKFMCVNHFTHMEGHMDEAPERLRGDPRVRPAWSFFSDVLNTQTADAVAEFVRRVEATLPGSRAVIGYSIGGAADNQMYNWQDGTWKRIGKPYKWGDYSKPARRAWKEWTADKYGSIEDLNTAWKTDYNTFEDVQPPPSRLLAGFDRLLFDPHEHRQASDYLRFMSEGRNGVILNIARAIKDASSHDVVVGCWGTPHIGGRGDATANDQLLRSDAVVMLGSQSTYGTDVRSAPGPGGVNAALMAHVVNGKIFTVDNDYPTWLSWGTRHRASPDIDMPTYRAQVRRESARMWSRGFGLGFHTLRWPWVYNDPKIKAELAQLYKWSPRFCDPYLENTANEIAVVYDEDATDYQARMNFQYVWTNLVLRELNQSGIPYRLYYTDDFRTGKVPRARAYVFVNPLRLDPAFMRELEKIRHGGITTVFLQGAGYAEQDVDLASMAVGMRLSGLGDYKGEQAPQKTRPPRKSALTDKLPIVPDGPVDYPLYKTDAYSHWGDIYQFKPGYILHPFSPAALKVVDPQAEKLAWYPGSDACGMAVKRHDDWTAVFMGAYTVNRQFYHNLARFSGAWAPVPPDNVFCANNRIVMLHPLHSGSVNITLEKACMLRELPPANGATLIETPSRQEHSLQVEAGKTYLFERIFP